MQFNRIQYLYRFRGWNGSLIQLAEYGKLVPLIPIEPYKISVLFPNAYRYSSTGTIDTRVPSTRVPLEYRYPSLGTPHCRHCRTSRRRTPLVSRAAGAPIFLSTDTQCSIRSTQLRSQKVHTHTQTQSFDTHTQ